MGEKEKSQVVIQSFNGMASVVDPNELKAGVSSEQVNVMVVRFGELQIRPGLRELQYDSD